MPKLQVNEDDGTITIPLKGRDPVVLDEPSALDLAWFNGAVEALEKELPVVESIDVKTATAEQVDRFQEQNGARIAAVYGNDETPPPYAVLLVEAIKRFSDGVEAVTLEQLPGWAASPATTRAILETFRDPLPGQA